MLAIANVSHFYINNAYELQFLKYDYFFSIIICSDFKNKHTIKDIYNHFTFSYILVKQLKVSKTQSGSKGYLDLCF